MGKEIESKDVLGICIEGIPGVATCIDCLDRDDIVLVLRRWLRDGFNEKDVILAGDPDRPFNPNEPLSCEKCGKNF